MWPMARLRWPVRRSDSNTASSSARGRPAYAEMAPTTRASRASGLSPVHQRGGGDGAGVDHRVHRPAGVRLQADGVEGVARRLDADLAPHLLGATVLEGDAVDQRLGDRLDRERLARRADLVDLAVDGGDGDAEPGGVGLGQLGDVAGHLAAAEVAEAGVKLFEVVLDRARRGGSLSAGRDAWHPEKQLPCYRVASRSVNSAARELAPDAFLGEQRGQLRRGDRPGTRGRRLAPCRRCRTLPSGVGKARAARARRGPGRSTTVTVLPPRPPVSRRMRAMPSPARRRAGARRRAAAGSDRLPADGAHAARVGGIHEAAGGGCLAAFASRHPGTPGRDWRRR